MASAAPGTTHDAGSPEGIRVIRYTDGRRAPVDQGWRQTLAAVRTTAAPADSGAIPRAGAPRGDFLWLALRSPQPDLLTEIADTFGLHELAVEDTADAVQRPKLEHYGDNWFLVLTATPADRTATSGGKNVSLFLGSDFVITVRHGAPLPVDDIAARLDTRPDLAALGPGSVVHAITDTLVDSYLDAFADIHETVEDLQSQAIAPAPHDDSTSLLETRRRLLALKHFVTPLEYPLSALSSGLDDTLPAELRRYFRDVLDHLLLVRDGIHRDEDALDSLFQGQMSRLSAQQNDDMRKISAWAAVIALPTLIAGIYGMNFRHMPELTWALGYPLSLAVMVLGCYLLWRAFRRNNWL
ncbi:magnesium and cobalt transport protein CorA [Streptomyces californicus]|uniref:magnesium and cobalt transport protein CorA n=1 Tax=Streptomyces californicus TaxID=67351 RepID=UPI00371A2B10